MGDRGIFKGYALQAIDGKGRVALPAAMRAVVERNANDKTLALCDDAAKPCLRLSDQAWVALLKARNDRDVERVLDAGGEADRDERNGFLGRFEDAPFDASGRFILPSFLKGKGKLDDWAFFWGAGDTIEMWSPTVLMAFAGADPAAKERCAWLMQERGIV